MSFTPDLEQQEQLAETLQLSQTAMSRRERLAEALIDGAFLATAVALLLVRPPHHFQPWPALLCVALLAIATRVEFDFPWGFTVATQLTFVPLMFTMAPALVPPAVVLGLMLAAIPELARGQLRPARLVKMVGNAWFTIGPVLVFVIAGVSPRHAGPWLLLTALGAQFAGDFLAAAVRFGLSHGSGWREQLSGNWVYLIDAALSGVGLVVAEEIQRARYAPLAILPLLGLLAVFARERKVRLAQLLELNEAYHGTALVLGDVVEADDGYTGEHSRGVVRLCLAVGARLGLGAQRMRNLEFGALLHDVGKIAIPKEIINKPGKLDEREWMIIRTHTIEGQKLLDTVGGFMRDVGLIVRSHHERWDGGGYPDGLARDQIPLESRIISVCDTWSAMRTDRSYRRSLPFNLAVEEMRSVAGSQLDPSVVAALLDIVADEALEEQPASLPRTNERGPGATSRALQLPTT
jgi:HD-GYP domain-containing protein (c-di-GMP phosphodiesterase class II)